MFEIPTTLALLIICLSGLLSILLGSIFPAHYRKAFTRPEIKKPELMILDGLASIFVVAGVILHADGGSSWPVVMAMALLLYLVQGYVESLAASFGNVEWSNDLPGPRKAAPSSWYLTQRSRAKASVQWYQLLMLLSTVVLISGTYALWKGDREPIGLTFFTLGYTVLVLSLLLQPLRHALVLRYYKTA